MEISVPLTLPGRSAPIVGAATRQPSSPKAPKGPITVKFHVLSALRTASALPTPLMQSNGMPLTRSITSW
jgi:hypothetical protein